MKPGDLVRLTRFDEIPFIGVYLGPSNRFDEKRRPYEGRFVLNTGIIKDVDLGNYLVNQIVSGNYLVWNFEVVR
jgi:hypothetical protein